MKLRATLLAISLAAGCANASSEIAPPDVARPAGFVDAATVIHGLVVDMRYHSSENFVGRPIAGYEAPVCLLTREAAEAAGMAQKVLEASGRRLKVYDCYRPAHAVADFAAWARDPSDQTRKADYYPNVDKSRLFELGYIAERSGHRAALHSTSRSLMRRPAQNSTWVRPTTCSIRAHGRRTRP